MNVQERNKNTMPKIELKAEFPLFGITAAQQDGKNVKWPEQLHKHLSHSWWLNFAHL